MTEARPAGRPRSNKAFLGRVRFLAVIVSIVAFAGSLTGIAVANPATANRSATVSQPQVLVQVPDFPARTNPGNLVLPAQPQMPRIQPMTRTRAS